jgi:hypothetical protein
LIGIAFEGGARLVHGFFDEIVAYPSGGVLVENGVHEGDFGGTAASFGFRGTILERDRRIHSSVI